MQLSELITQLTLLKDRHGDLEVHLFSDAHAGYLNESATRDIERIEYDDAHDDIFIELGGPIDMPNVKE